jgi:hypothetical protein
LAGRARSIFIEVNEEETLEVRLELSCGSIRDLRSSLRNSSSQIGSGKEKRRKNKEKKHIHISSTLTATVPAILLLLLMVKWSSE